jgi:hypothetical protein
MSSDKTDRLRTLVDSVCEGRISAAEVQQLEQLLSDDPQAQDFYLRRVQLHAALRWDQRGAAEWSALKQLREMGRDASGAPAERRHGWRRALYALLGTAACLGLAWLAWSQRSGGRPPVPATALARIAFAEGDADFQADPLRPQARIAAGADLGAGRLNLKSGVVRLDFASGAAVTLEGPAQLALLSATRARLDSGRLTALALPEAHGFRIDTPGLQVVDLGTVFGVTADESGAAEVLVFSGEVELALTNASAPSRPAEPQRLGEGDAARADSLQGRIEAIDFDGRQFSRSWPITYGVLEATGVVKFVEPAPFIIPGRYEDDDHLIVFPERNAVWLKQDVTVALAAPGTYAGPFEEHSTTISAGRRVRTYLLQFNPVGRKNAPVKRMAGSATFDRPILGLICTNKQLLATDATLGAEKIERFPRGGRGVEDGDTLVLSGDRRTLHVDLTAANATDQIRVVLDASPETGNLAETIAP